MSAAATDADIHREYARRMLRYKLDREPTDEEIDRMLSPTPRATGALGPATSRAAVADAVTLRLRQRGRAGAAAGRRTARGR